MLAACCDLYAFEAGLGCGVQRMHHGRVPRVAIGAYPQRAIRVLCPLRL